MAYERINTDPDVLGGRAAGYDVSHVRDIGLQGATDQAVMDQGSWPGPADRE
jgi:hypothetical protein